jgi:hypothetical protein
MCSVAPGLTPTAGRLDPELLRTSEPPNLPRMTDTVLTVIPID